MATTHLTNTITAAIGHMRGTPDFEWDHRIAERVLEVIAQHDACKFCHPDEEPQP